MNIKQFLKPNWKKIVITIILALPSLIMWGCEDNFNLFSCPAMIWESFGFFWFFYYLITYPVFLILRLLASLGLENLQNFLTVILIFIIYLIYWYLLFSLIAWLYNKYNITKDKPSTKKIIKIIRGLSIALLSILGIINSLFSVYMLAYIGMEPSARPDSLFNLLFLLVILFTSPFIFISGILLLLRVKWTWKFFLSVLIGGIFLAVLITLG